MDQAGLAGCVVRAVQACHPYIQPLLFESIMLTGGSTLFPQFAERLQRELRPLVPEEYQVKIIPQEKRAAGFIYSRRKKLYRKQNGGDPPPV